MAVALHQPHVMDGARAAVGADWSAMPHARAENIGALPLTARGFTTVSIVAAPPAVIAEELLR